MARPCPLNGRARFLIEVPSPDAKLFIDGRRFNQGVSL